MDLARINPPGELDQLLEFSGMTTGPDVLVRLGCWRRDHFLTSTFSSTICRLISTLLRSPEIYQRSVHLTSTYIFSGPFFFFLLSFHFSASFLLELTFGCFDPSYYVHDLAYVDHWNVTTRMYQKQREPGSQRRVFHQYQPRQCREANDSSEPDER